MCTTQKWGTAQERLFPFSFDKIDFRNQNYSGKGLKDKSMLSRMLQPLG